MLQNKTKQKKSTFYDIYFLACICKESSVDIAS